MTGLDDKGREFTFSAGFYYGSNAVSGKVVDDSGSTLTALAGKTVVLSGFNSGIRRSAAIQANGTFSIANVPTDSYSLSLADPSLAYFGSTLFFVETGGSSVSVNLKIAGVGAGATRLPLPAAAKDASAAPSQKDRSFGAFSQNPPIEPRPLPARFRRAVRRDHRDGDGITVTGEGRTRSYRVEGNRQPKSPKHPYQRSVSTA